MLCPVVSTSSDNDFLPFDIPRDTVVLFEDAFLAALGLMQAAAWLEHIDIVQPRCQFRLVFADVPVETLEATGILELVAARHEHDMIGLAVRLQGGHARLEELDAMYLALLELIERTAERPLFIVEQVCVPRRIVIPVESDFYSMRLERLERLPVLEKVGARKAEHPARLPVPGHYRQTAVTVAFLGSVGCPCGGVRRIPGFPSPVADDKPQPRNNAEQDQKDKPLVHHKIKSNGSVSATLPFSTEAARK